MAAPPPAAGAPLSRQRRVDEHRLAGRANGGWPGLSDSVQTRRSMWQWGSSVNRCVVYRCCW